MIFDWKTEHNRYRRYFVNLKKVTERSDVRSFTNLTLTFFLISIMGFLAIKPTLVIIANLAKEIKEKEEINQKLKSKIVSLVKAQEEYSLNQDRFFLLDQALPNTPDFPTLVSTLEKQANEAGVIFNSFSIDKILLVEKKETKETKEDKISSFEFNLSLSGEYDNLKEFLIRLEELRRIVNFSTVSLGAKKEPGKENVYREIFNLRLNVSGKANYFPLNEK